MTADFELDHQDDALDFIDLRDADLADQLQVSDQCIREFLRQHPTLGPTIQRQTVCDLLDLHTLLRSSLEK